MAIDVSECNDVLNDRFSTDKQESYKVFIIITD